MTIETKKTLGFIGIGRMGYPMAHRLLDAGHGLVVCDTNDAAVQGLLDRGARRAGTPKAVADEAEVVLMSLPLPAIVRDVALGPQGIVHGAAVKTVIDLSTTGRTVSEAVASGLLEHAIETIDCPVSGGVAGATKGTLALMVSGDPVRFEVIRPILAQLGKLIYVGEKAGMAQTMKVINNLISVTSLAITSEAMAMGAKAGLDADTMVEVFNAGSGRTSASLDKIPNFVLTGGFDFGFTLGLSVKDVGLCLSESRALGLQMDIGAAAQNLLAQTHAAYGPDADLTEIARFVEEREHVQLRGKAATKTS
jgi:3-hydroxyisobutyrate dehydrogenase-like beta-hydroxyacid dehydrogenase